MVEDPRRRCMIHSRTSSTCTSTAAWTSGPSNRRATIKQVLWPSSLQISTAQERTVPRLPVDHADRASLAASVVGASARLPAIGLEVELALNCWYANTLHALLAVDSVM